MYRKGTVYGLTQTFIQYSITQNPSLTLVPATLHTLNTLQQTSFRTLRKHIHSYTHTHTKSNTFIPFNTKHLLNSNITNTTSISSSLLSTSIRYQSSSSSSSSTDSNTGSSVGNMVDTIKSFFNEAAVSGKDPKTRPAPKPEGKQKILLVGISYTYTRTYTLTLMIVHRDTSYV